MREGSSSGGGDQPHGTLVLGCRVRGVPGRAGVAQVSGPGFRECMQGPGSRVQGVHAGSKVQSSGGACRFGSRVLGLGLGIGECMKGPGPRVQGVHAGSRAWGSESA